MPLPDGIGKPTAIAVGGTPASILLAGSGPGLYRRMLGSTLRTSSPLELARRAGPMIAERAMTIVRSRTGGGTAVAAPPKRPATVDLRGWAKLNAPKLASPREVTTITATLEAWYAAVAGEGLWASTDGGVNWSRCEGLPADVHAVRAVAGRPGQLIAATSEGVWFSGDAGKSWEWRSKGLESAPDVRAIESCPDQPDFLLAGAAPAKPASGPAPIYGLYESKDAGKSWVRVLRSFPENPRRSDRRHPLRPGRARQRGRRLRVGRDVGHSQRRRLLAALRPRHPLRRASSARSSDPASRVRCADVFDW